MRIAVATLATIVALPVLLGSLTSGRDGTAPVAAVPGGADIANSLRAAASANPTPTRETVPAQRSNLPRATSPTQPAVIDIAIPASLPPTSVKGKASFRNLGSRDGTPSCQTPSVAIGTQVKVVNLDNGHELTCVVRSNVNLPAGQVIAVDTAAFAQLGDPVQSPLPVRITW